MNKKCDCCGLVGCEKYNELNKKKMICNICNICKKEIEYDEGIFDGESYTCFECLNEVDYAKYIKETKEVKMKTVNNTKLNLKFICYSSEKGEKKIVGGIDLKPGEEAQILPGLTSVELEDYDEN